MLLEHSRPGLVVQRALELFVDNIRQHFVVEAKIGYFPAAVFAFPSVIGALGDPILPADRVDGTAAFDLSHDFGDLALAVASFLHRTFSFGGNI